MMIKRRRSEKRGGTQRVSILCSEDYLAFYYFRAQAYRLLDGCQVLHQEYPLVRGLLEGHGVFQDLGIPGVLGELDHVAFQILHQVVVEAVILQELEGIVPRAGGFELEAKQVFVVVVQKRIE